MGAAESRKGNHHDRGQLRHRVCVGGLCDLGIGKPILTLLTQTKVENRTLTEQSDTARVLVQRSAGLDDATYDALLVEARASKGGTITSEPVDNLAGGARRLRIVQQPAMERYYQRKEITRRQHLAAERLHGIWEAAMSGRASAARWNAKVDGGRLVPAIEPGQYSLDLHAALLGVGRHLSPVLVGVCLHGMTAGDYGKRFRDRERDGIAVLRLALDVLANHWRMK